MKKKKILTWLAIVLAFVILVPGGLLFIYHKRHESVPYSQLFSYQYWVRHLSGHDEFDPDTYMLYRGNPDLREVALTIDDGPHELYGQQVLDVLSQYHVPATFFVVGVRVKQEPELIREMVAQGHEVANHTYDHQRLSNLKPHSIANELRYDSDDIFHAAGIYTSVMRPPGVNYNEKVLSVTKALGYVTVNWTNAAKDYDVQSPTYIVDHIVDSTENGSIILLHQDNPYTAQALPRIIKALHEKGYRFVTISTMLAHLGVQPYKGQQEAADISAGRAGVAVVANGCPILHPPGSAPLPGPIVAASPSMSFTTSPRPHVAKKVKPTVAVTRPA